MINNKITKLLVSLLILGILIYKIGIDQIISLLKTTNPIYFIHFTILTFVALILSGINLKVLLTKHKNEYTLRELVKCSVISWTFCLITPGRLGELALIPLLKKEKVNLGEVSAVIITDKIISLISLVIIAGIGFFYFLSYKNAMLYALISVVALILIIALIYSKFTRDIIKRYIIKKLSAKFKGFNETMIDLLKHNKSGVILNFISTVLRWLVSTFIIYYLFLSIGTKVPITPIFLIHAITTIISYIPITIEGIGLKEGSAVLLYSYLSIPASIVLTAYLLAIFYRYILGVFCGAIFIGDLKNLFRTK